MNADLKRVRENAIDDQSTGSPSPAKRRILAGNASPSVDSSDGDGMEDWMKVVETKRKEAIYRQMLEYRRASEREAKRANDLEAQRRVLEASFHAVEICWTQVVSAIRDMAGRHDVKLRESEVLEPVLDPQLGRPELEKALQSRLPSTKQLVSCFVDLAARNGHKSASMEEVQTRCLKLEAESGALRSNTKLLQSQISALTESRDSAQRELQHAQKALDRERMEHDKAQQEWKEERARGRDNGTPGAPGSHRGANGSGHATPNGKVEEDAKPFSNGGAGPSAAGVLQDTSELESLAESRLQQLQALRTEQVHLQQEVDRLKLLADHPSETALRASPFFQVYLNQLSSQINRANVLQARFETTEKKLDELRDSNGDFREAVLAEAKAETDALRQQMMKKDSDLARLRGQRDEMNAELFERRAREADKLKFAEQVEALAKARQDRITFLSSEVRRLKGKLAAQHGAEGYLSFLKDTGIDGDYVKNLEEKVTSAQDQITALTSQLQRVSSDPAAAEEESKARTELESVRRTLAKYEKVLGPNPDAAEDVRQLATRLEEKETERASLELKLSEAEASTNALYSEVEGLSKLWEGLDQTIHSKAFELKDGELRISRLTTEKAKADNKYFAAMRSKEAVDAECKSAQRSVEKQLKLLERAQEVETHLRTQIASTEKGLTSLKNSALELQTTLASTMAEKTQIELRLQHSQSTLAEAQQIMHQRVAEATAEKEARAKLQDEAEASTRTIKKLKERQEAMAAVSSTNMSAGEWQMKEERDKLLKLLRCSCCEQNFKQQVIVKCMHTFCKSCLEQRIASRQRKCPACGLSFAKEDVQTLYWQ
ncbi:E3 ubiquitin-protein ligase BRE1 [Kwoniella shandongensis]|uniref:E3 ubiquitin protein ligase n=1 Tax=Kwoniella shandongensis TaxID=1734106 RepID=A0A5M6C2E0_9TREE|nr:E3 ubiquitin-protein ligase BRE1 [Kwoniella shandongensis]KAA5528790.1 E3 ubiquitin-protein ligase BRE1 [Kwoniella shandongensis]